MNVDKRIRYLESQLTRQRKEIRSLRIAIDERDREIVELRGSIPRPTTTELDYFMPRQPSLGELMFGRDA